MNHMSVSDHSDENLTITGWVQVVVKFVLMWSSVCCRYKLNILLHSQYSMCQNEFRI